MSSRGGHRSCALPSWPFVAMATKPRRSAGGFRIVMVKRAPDMTASDGTRWRVGIAALAIVLVAAVTVGVGAVSVRTSDDAITPLPAPNAVLPFSPATPTATPRVIAVPETSPAPTPTEAIRPTVTATPGPAALATTGHGQSRRPGSPSTMRQRSPSRRQRRSCQRRPRRRRRPRPRDRQRRRRP